MAWKPQPLTIICAVVRLLQLLSFLENGIATSTAGFVVLPHHRSADVITKGAPISLPTARTATSGRPGRGFGGDGGRGGGSDAKPRGINKNSIGKKVTATTTTITSTPENTRLGTEERIEYAMRALPAHVQMAMQLYQHLNRWDAHWAGLSLLQQTQVPTQELDGARRAREELQSLYLEHQFNETDLHNMFQRITWDAAADAKAARAATGKMPREVALRVERACAIIGEAVRLAGDSGRCLDVGCGYGVLVPFLNQAGVAQSKIYGIDLSAEMIRNARELHSNVNFQVGNFLQYTPETVGPTTDGVFFDGIIFCSSLHDLPDPVAAIRRAACLLKSNGRLVIVHPQGASHVLNQWRSNPILVKRGLPDESELRDWCEAQLELVVAPAKPNSSEESKLGYLAVMRRI